MVSKAKKERSVFKKVFWQEPMSTLSTKYEEIIICGYLRDIMNDDISYQVIITLILEYFLNYAKYYDRTNATDTEEKEKLHFGDIIKTSFMQYRIIDINHAKINIATRRRQFFRRDMGKKYTIQMTIPYEICQHLINAPKFFSKFDEIEEFDVSEYNKSLIIKHDDMFVIHKFGSKLNPKYHKIALTFNIMKRNGRIYKSESLRIHYNEKYSHSFDLADFNYSCKDFEDFFEIRQDMKSLIKITVRLHSKKWCQFKCPAYSPIWNCKYHGFDAYLYIGPKSEMQQMLAKLNEFRKDKSVTITVDKLKPEDWCLNYEYIEAQKQKIRQIKAHLE